MHRLENNYNTEVLPVLSPTSGFPDWGLEMEEPPENPALESSRAWLQEFCGTGGDWSFTPGGRTQGLCTPEPKEKAGTS